MFIKSLKLLLLSLFFLNFSCYSKISDKDVMQYGEIYERMKHDHLERKKGEKEAIKVHFDNKISFFIAQTYYNEGNHLFSKYIFYNLIQDNDLYNKYSYKSKIYLALSKFKHGKIKNARKTCKSVLSIKHILNLKSLNFVYFLKASIFCSPSKNIFFNINRYKVDDTFIKKSFRSLSKINTRLVHMSYASLVKDKMYKVEVEIKKHRLYIAKYYYNKGAYISVVKRLHHFNHSCIDEYDYQSNYLLLKSYNELYLSDISEKLLHFVPSKYFKQKSKRI
ncbi:MAG TPA: outer membrane protein assembly factor BamD [Candidatus Azoamicus sp. MARI]